MFQLFLKASYIEEDKVTIGHCYYSNFHSDFKNVEIFSRFGHQNSLSSPCISPAHSQLELDCDPAKAAQDSRSTQTINRVKKIPKMTLTEHST